MSNRNPVRSTRANLVSKREDPKNNVFVVEKVLNKRHGRQGSIEFLIKWQGFPDSDNTWEPRENLRCSKILEEFEREYAKREKQTRKRKFSPPSAPRDASTSLPAASTQDQWQGKSLKTIIGLTKAPGELHFLCKFTDESVHLVPARDVNTRFPSQVIKFYESRLSIQEHA